MRWNWDPIKATRNKKSPPAGHGIPFELASLVFDDPEAVSFFDEHEDGDRWNTIGRPALDRWLVLFVVHTLPHDEGGSQRIVSARPAEQDEEAAYYAGIQFLGS